MRKITLGVAFLSAAVFAFLRGSAQNVESVPTVAEAKDIRVRWEPADGIEVYLLESRPTGDIEAPWGVRSVRGTETVIPAPDNATEFRVRAVHPKYPEVISNPSPTVVYPQSGDAPVEMVRVLGLDSKGGVWEQTPEGWIKLL